MTCPYCGKAVPAGNPYCLYCGTRQESDYSFEELLNVHLTEPVPLTESLSLIESAQLLEFLQMMDPLQGTDPVVPEQPVATEFPVAESPVVTEMPIMTEAPVVAEPPVVNETPVAVATPVVAEPPAATEPPVAAETPAEPPKAEKPAAKPRRKPVNKLRLPTKRGLGKMFFLGILTVGIYPTVIWSRISTELNIVAGRHDGRRTLPFFGMIILTPLTLGILPWVWMHNFCCRVGDDLKFRRIDYKFGPKVFWLWGVLGSLILVGPFIFTHKLMNAMNLLNEDFNKVG